HLQGARRGRGDVPDAGFLPRGEAQRVDRSDPLERGGRAADLQGGIELEPEREVASVSGRLRELRPDRDDRGRCLRWQGGRVWLSAQPGEVGEGQRSRW